MWYKNSGNDGNRTVHKPSVLIWRHFWRFEWKISGSFLRHKRCKANHVTQAALHGGQMLTQNLSLRLKCVSEGNYLHLRHTSQAMFTKEYVLTLTIPTPGPCLLITRKPSEYIPHVAIGMHPNIQTWPKTVGEIGCMLFNEILLHKDVGRGAVGSTLSYLVND